MKLHKVLLTLLLASYFQNSFCQLSWYKNFSGKIDQYPFYLHLHKFGNNYTGFYYYSSQQQPIYVLGDDTTIAGQVRLSAWLPDRETDEIFIFIIADSTLDGIWKSNATKKSFLITGKQVINAALPLFDYVYTEGSHKLRPKLENSPAASYEAGSVWPSANSTKSALLKKWIGEQFHVKQSQQDIGQYLLEEKKEFLAGYMEENKDMKDSEVLEYGFSLNMDATMRLMIAYQSEKILTLALYSYDYSGGAHGNYGTSYNSYDLLANKKLKLADVITAPGKAQLPKLLEKYFRKTYKLSVSDPLTEGGLFENKILPNENFYVTGKGIGFSYMPYEIAPYAAGELAVFIPFTELKNYLMPGFKKLLE